MNILVNKSEENILDESKEFSLINNLEDWSLVEENWDIMNLDIILKESK